MLCIPWVDLLKGTWRPLICQHCDRRLFCSFHSILSFPPFFSLTSLSASFPVPQSGISTIPCLTPAAGSFSLFMITSFLTSPLLLPLHKLLEHLQNGRAAESSRHSWHECEMRGAVGEGLEGEADDREIKEKAQKWCPNSLPATECWAGA